MFDLNALGLFFLFGTLIGSFLNVVIYRLPLGLSVVTPRSRCGSCSKTISWYDNVPILSWCILRGRCRNCQAKISVRYPLVEFLTGVAFALAYYRIGICWVLVEALIFISMAVAAAAIDLDHMILPDKITLSGIVIGLIGGLINPERSFWDAVFGVLLGGGFLWSIAYLYFVIRKREGMGGGDIKLLAWIGAVMGWKAIPFVILGSSLTGAVIGALIAMRSAKDQTQKLASENEVPMGAIPFGPFLIAAALFYFLGFADWFSELYLEVHGLN